MIARLYKSSTAGFNSKKNHWDIIFVGLLVVEVVSVVVPSKPTA